jgi:hypothetical protein
MEGIQNIRDVFSKLHDGTIIEYGSDKSSLTLKVSCQYLAERLDPTFEIFFVELAEVSGLTFVPWMNPFDLEQQYFVEINDIFQAELDILSAEIEQGFVKVSCNQRDPVFNYCGGILYISCKDIRIYDQNRIGLTIERLNQICNEYWDEFAG